MTDPCNSELIKQLILAKACEKEKSAAPHVHFVDSALHNDFINNLEEYPHAYVIGCLMDRQIKSHRAWGAPYELLQRIGSFRFDDLAKLSLEDIRYYMSSPEPLHRFTESMPTLVHKAIAHIGNEYAGDARNIWNKTPSSATLVRRFLEFEGMGPKIATMAANILVRDFRIPVSDKYSIDVSVDVHVRRVFTRLGLTSKNASNETIIYKAREMNPVYPGILDLAMWELGKNICKTKPNCQQCFMAKVCPSAQVQ